MCVINFNELSHSDLHASVVEDFAVWFKSLFGTRNVSVQSVIGHYINRPQPNIKVTEHLLDLLPFAGTVFDPEMDRYGKLHTGKMLFIPEGTVVRSDVRAKGIYCVGDVLFKADVVNEHLDIRIKGAITAKSLMCAKSSCLANSLTITDGDLSCEGDLMIDSAVRVSGSLMTLGHLKAFSVQVGKEVCMAGGVEIANSITISKPLPTMMPALF